MNEPSSENTPVQPPSLPDFKDRSTGLTVFGILTLLLGCAAGLMVLMMLAATSVAPTNPNTPPTPLASVILVIFMYGGLAVSLIWLGIGSVMARRWARALLLIFSWAWLVMGIILMPVMGFFLPKVWENMPAINGRPAMPPGAITIMMIVMLLVVGFFFVLLPAIWIFFYSSRHVKATCERRDPVTRWTDACPLPVLGMCLWLLMSVPMMLIMPVMSHGLMPFFGMLLTGLPGSFLWLVVAALYGYCAWRLYKMDVRAWWITLVVILLFTLSNVITYSEHNILEIYHAMGYPQAVIDQIQKMGMFTGNSMAWMMLIVMVPCLGYILFVKKYLPGSKTSRA